MSAALIVGCSVPRGRAVALAMAKAGHSVVAATKSPKSLTGLDELAGASVVQCELTDPASRTALVTQALARLGRIDVLVIDGGASLVGPTEEIPGEMVRHQFEANFFGPLEVMKETVPSMVANGSGRIVNLSSAGAVMAAPYFGPSCACQQALDAVTMSLDWELRPFGVRAVTVAAGGFGGDLSADRPPADRPTTRYPQPREVLRTYGEQPPAPAELSDITDAVLAAAFDDDPPSRVATAETAQLLGPLLDEAEALHRRIGHWFD